MKEGLSGSFEEWVWLQHSNVYIFVSYLNIIIIAVKKVRKSSGD